MRGPSLSLPEEVARISKQVWAAALLIAAPLWFNTTFAVLGKRFDYPDILRRPTPEILERFREGGPSLILLWWGFMLSGFLMIGAVVLLSQALGFGGVLPLATTIGVLAGLVQVLGLLRWVYLVPRLARDHADPHASPARREATAAIVARAIALPRTLAQILDDHIKAFPSPGGHLFAGPEGGALRPNNFRERVFYPAAKAAGLIPPALRVHDLRHTCAALLVAQGAHVKEIAARLGHKNPNVTLSVYSHILPSLDERTSEGLEQTFLSAKESAAPYLPPEDGVTKLRTDGTA
jgi:hypothetical protein